MHHQFAKFVEVIICMLLVVLLTACGPTDSPATEILNQPPQSSSTLEPTLVPSPPPTDTPIATPTDMPPPEPTSTSGPRAGLSGWIFDQATNQPIPDAQVRAGEQTTTTNANGRYTLAGLEPGQYVLSVVIILSSVPDQWIELVILTGGRCFVKENGTPDNVWRGYQIV